MSTRAAALPPARRLGSLFLILALCFGSVAVRLFTLQLRDAGDYAAMARDQRIRRIDLPPTRGSIVDRNGADLAMSLPAVSIYADPGQLPDRGAAARSLAPVLGMSVEEVEDILARPAGFVYLARRVDTGIGERVRRLRLPGVGVLEESRRSYPAGSLASQVVGFVGVDGPGLAGVELQHDRALSGRPGSLVVEQDPAGNRIPQGEHRLEEPRPGDDLVLTIDRDIQFHAERALARAVKRNGAKGGTLIAMDPATGEILAMANYPWFDANRPGAASPDALRNRAVTDVYEPGSVNKVITASAAIEEGLVAVDELFDVPDRHRVGPKVFRDAHPHAPMAMTLADIVAQSSNVGSIKVAQRLGKGRMSRYLKRFGFGQRTGVGFPGEGEGILPPKDEWWETGIGTIPIGQGVAVTPLQITAVYATIANEGIWVQPRLVRGRVDAAGRFRRAAKPERRRVVSARTARTITPMLSYAVEEGTGTEAQIPGYWVAGKTGTARKPSQTERGYSDEYVATFVGFAPARAPRLVVAAILDEPDTVYGGIAAAPLFREVARSALARLRVPMAPKPPTPITAQGL